MYSLQENIDFYSKASESLWKYYRHEPALDNDNDIIGFPADGNSSIFFKTANSKANKKQWHKRCWNNGSLKNLSNFWRTLEMALINCEISLILTYPKNCFLVAGTATNQVPTFK